MRTFTWLIMAGLAASTTGCLETADSGDPSTSYAANDGYYSQPTYYGQAPENNYYPANNYYYLPPQVVAQTRYVPVLVPEERNADHHWNSDRSDHRRDGDRDDHRRDGNRDGNAQHQDEHRWAGSQGSHPTSMVAHPTPSQVPVNNGQQQTNHRRSNGPDRNGEGTPDAPRADRRG